MLLANRYDDRTHFIFELLQNAEDAIARRTQWSGSRAVSFELESDGLRVSHFGVPFDHKDVRGVCGIGESTKELTAIGRFGIGFKSIYAFSDRPEVHSGSEDFAVESFVWPVAVGPVERDKDETVILIPFREGDDASKLEVAGALSRLGADSLLFLQKIEEIRWSVDGHQVGLYLRQSEVKAPGIRLVTVIGKEEGKSEVDGEWLVFARPVHTNEGHLGGHVEVAWSTTESENGSRRLRSVGSSPLVVFFPTVVETGLGFLIQGPYRTTPSRDNVPQRDEWNRNCVRETGALLFDSLRWLRDEGLVDAAALTCLPLNSEKFEGSMFKDLFEETKKVLRQEALLPVFGGHYASAADGRLARTEELRQLLSPPQLGALHGQPRPLFWLDGSISRDRTPQLRQYLIDVLGVAEFTPEMLLRRLTVGFLEGQADDWVQNLYAFLASQPALRSRAASQPIIRLEDGSHVQAFVDGEPKAFLPGAVKTSFPTVRVTVCQSSEASEFLKSIGLTEPDPVDNVIRNVLPKYREDHAEFSADGYAFDIRLMLAAAATDSNAQRDKLVAALREMSWVRAVDFGNGRSSWAKPADLYLATERLQKLFAGVDGVLLVDPSVTCLKGENVRTLLESSGAARYLQPVSTECDLPDERLRAIRRSNGLERATWSKIEDTTIRGLDTLIDKLPTMDQPEICARAQDLWEALDDLCDRRGSRAFEASYKWGFHQEQMVAPFDAAFIRTLNGRRWVPDLSGRLRSPGPVSFEDIDWKPNSLLESKIRFRPPQLAQLAKEAGVEPGLLDLLRQIGVTSEAELRKRLGVQDDGKKEARIETDSRSFARTSFPDQEAESTHARGRESENDRSSTTAFNSESDENGRTRPQAMPGENQPGQESQTNDATDAGERQRHDDTTRLQFVSYVGVEREQDTDPDGLEHAARMQLEDAAINFILDFEPEWRRTPINNRGFDLYRGDALHKATRWCEVKAMTGTLEDRPVAISHAQFEWARQHGEHYWLYIVERTGTSTPNIVRIQDPNGKAKNFTFDRGWRVTAIDGTSGNV